METFKFLLFGFAGVSIVLWVAIIALWHTYMFPRFFNEDKGLNSVINEEISYSKKPILGTLVKSNNFSNREKYSIKNLVIADFSSASNNFKLNKLYTTVMIGVTFASFIFYHLWIKQFNNSGKLNGIYICNCFYYLLCLFNF